MGIMSTALFDVTMCTTSTPRPAMTSVTNSMTPRSSHEVPYRPQLSTRSGRRVNVLARPVEGHTVGPKVAGDIRDSNLLGVHESGHEIENPGWPRYKSQALRARRSQQRNNPI